jgi:hypothetical protein
MVHNEHLLSKDYQQLSVLQAKTKIEDMKITLKKLTQKAEQTLFQRSFSFNIEYQYSMAYQKSIKNPLSL